jgi:hypothetical protein
VKSLNRSCCETDVVQSVSSKLVSELDLRHANIIRVDEAQTGWCDAAVFVMWVGRGCSFEHGQGHRMELLGSIFSFSLRSSARIWFLQLITFASSECSFWMVSAFAS